jgi:hypothetical protein
MRISAESYERLQQQAREIIESYTGELDDTDEAVVNELLDTLLETLSEIEEEGGLFDDTP